jgi:hypothetical protein
MHLARVLNKFSILGGHVGAIGCVRLSRRFDAVVRSVTSAEAEAGYNH